MLYGRVSRGLGGPFHSNVTIAGEQVSFSFRAIEHAFSGKHCSGKRGDVLAAGFYGIKRRSGEKYFHCFNKAGN
jgi:hypothetical protein